MPRTRSLAWSELKIGIITVIALAIATGLIFLLSGEGGFFWQRYSIKTVFPDVAGLKPGAPVRVAGLEVGSVTAVDFVGDRVEVVMQVGRDRRLRCWVRRPSIARRPAPERRSRNGAMCPSGRRPDRLQVWPRRPPKASIRPPS